MRSRGRIPALIGLLALVFAAASPCGATIRSGSIQISGNLSTQNLFHIQGGSQTFTAFDPVQQRNTLRLQYEQEIVRRGELLGTGVEVPGIRSAGLFAYYRFVYDSIFDIAPGALLRTQSGAPAGRIRDLKPGLRSDVAFENNLREIFLDVKTTGHVSFRIGRQQIVWGEALFLRALDSVNALDLSWHPIENGVFGKVGLDELRIPSWAFKMLVDLGSFEPFSEAYVEAYDIPFDFEPSYARFEPAPTSAPLRTPFRGGLVVDGAVLGLPPNLARVQGCLDLTGNPDDNYTATASGHAPDYSHAAETGLCNSRNLPVTSIHHGLYDRRDPRDVNQVGVRFGANVFGIGFTLAYLHRRHLGGDIPGSTALRAPFGVIDRTSLSKFGYLAVDAHETTDPILRRKTFVEGYIRIPGEFYYPYVHVAGLSANYFEPWTAAVFTLEGSVTHGLPIAQPDLAHGSLMKRKDVLLGAVGFDRPTWIRWLNRTSTWTIAGQVAVNWIPGHDRLHRAGTIPGTSIPNYAGDVGVPFITVVPEVVDGGNRLDDLKGVELITLLAALSFYRGGSFVPQVAWVSDWSYTPSMGFLAGFDYYVTNDLIVTPGLAVFTNFGRVTDDAFGIGRLSQWDEVKLKVTYQF